MAETAWTRAQQDAISARQGTVLVAAAAGSGKTAVLVQRAIERLTDRENPVPADRLLIVTFTKAAAQEMRARLEQRLWGLIRENPENPVLRRQSLLLPQAHIGTVDSFCAEMVREFFHVLDISPEFTILSDKREEELCGEALEEALQAAFESGEVAELADAFTGERDDRRLAAMVRTLYRFMQSHPFPERWLEDKVALYEQGDEALWEGAVLSYAKETAAYCCGLLEAGQEAAAQDVKLEENFGPVFTEDRRQLSALMEACAAGDWDKALALRQAFAPSRRKPLRGYKEDPLFCRLDACRKEVAKALEPLEKCLCGTRGENCRELQEAAPLLKSLQALTLDFSRRYREKKRERDFLDYSDLEHLAIELFCRPDGSPTPVAKEVSARFGEIMIDEYQDINEVQDSLFRAVSQDEKNLFMVGDVKQSIYGFRRAMPEIFLRRRKSFPLYDREQDSYPASIVLDRNFRSRREVTESVNFVFSQLMSREAGDIDYTGEERLVCAAPYEDKAGCETEVLLIDRQGVPAETAEAAAIGKRIREMVEGGFPITAKEGERPACWGDFCILLRSANKYAHRYARELAALGVPARAASSGGFFAAKEVQAVLSLLRVIDNPNQDIPLLAVLMSPLYGFTPDDLARLREGDRKSSLYISLLRGAKENALCRRVLEEVGELRSLCATMPADAFLTLLYSRTGYPDMVLAMEEGRSRLENLRLLQQYAKEYEGSGYHGLSGFVRFLDRLREGGADLQAAQPQQEDGPAVQIMSVHRAKGLEFPVCIVAGCGRSFVTDQREDVLLHPVLGLGVKLKDAARSARYTTTAREAIALESARSSAAEELRVLYVAMTRAKEKLILAGSGEKMEEMVGKLAMRAAGAGVSPYLVRKAKNALEWLVLCALRHPDGGELRKTAGAEDLPLCRESFTPWRIQAIPYAPPPLPEAGELEEVPPPDLMLAARLRERASFQYPYAERLEIPAKVSASKLAAEQGGAGEISLSRPAWLGEKGMTPAERGIALHEFMQFADFHAAAENPEKELIRLVEKAWLTPEQGEAVDVHRVRAFFQGSLGRRVLASAEVLKERRFTVTLPAHMVREGLEDGGLEEQVVLQGAVDCTFLEGGRIHIIDFKTDRVETVEELWQRYQVQIRLYAYAMEQAAGQQVGDLVLYSTYLSQACVKPYSRDAS